jgi:hypothetical protein
MPMQPQSQTISNTPTPTEIRDLLFSSTTHKRSRSTTYIYTQAAITNAGSVLMAEATALDLAALITSHLNMQSPNYLSDDQSLVTFNGNDFSPPDWRIKSFTNRFIASNAGRHHKIYKIARQLNTTADLVAKQALQALQSNSSMMSPAVICSNQEHSSSCPLRNVMNFVILEPFVLLTARCC